MAAALAGAARLVLAAALIVAAVSKLRATYTTRAETVALIGERFGPGIAPRTAVRRDRDRAPLARLVVVGSRRLGRDPVAAVHRSGRAGADASLAVPVLRRRSRRAGRRRRRAAQRGVARVRGARDCVAVGRVARWSGDRDVGARRRRRRRGAVRRARGNARAAVRRGARPSWLRRSRRSRPRGR